MKSPIKLRLTGFLATVALGAIVIGWTERHAWRQTDQFQKRFEAIYNEASATPHVLNPVQRRARLYRENYVPSDGL